MGVSTYEQLHDLQIDSLKAAGCERIYTDTCSGSVPGAERPELQSILAYARTGDTFIVWRLDRPGRSLQDLIGQINERAEREVDDRMLARAAELLMRDRTLGINEICRIVSVGKTTLCRDLTPDGQRRGERLPDVAR